MRHGQTYSNIERRLDTRPPGAELSERGRDQARAAGEELAAVVGDRPVRLYSSVALRAQQTAQLAARAWEKTAGWAEHSLPVTVLPGVHEIYAGELEMSSSEDAHREYMVALRGWLDGDAGAAMSGGETLGDVLGRYQPVLESLATGLGDEEDAVLVSHGAAIRVATKHATGVDADFAFSGYLDNCRYTMMEPRGEAFGRWALIRWAGADLG